MKKAVFTTTILSLLLPLNSGEAHNINSRFIGLSSEGIVLLANNVKGLNIEGKLDNNSQTFDDGTYYNVHTFEGKTGETLTIDLTSEDFDAYLILLDPDGEKIAENDNGEKGNDARIVIELPKTGTYTVGVNTAKADETGNYQLITRQATQRDIILAEAEQLNQQAYELYQQGRYTEAEPLYLQALAIRKKQLGDKHLHTAISLNNLGLLYQSQGRYTEAEPFYQQALAITKEQLGDNHPFTTTNLNNLATLYESQGRYTEAEPIYQQVLAIRKEQLGENHLDTASSLNNLARVYESQGKYSEAESLYQQTLAIRKIVLGEDHPNTASSLNNLALLYKSQGRYAEAEPLYQQALAIFRKQLGDNHPDTATTIDNLAALYQSQGRYTEAEPLYQQALAIRKEQLGDKHRRTAISLNNLATLYRSQGRYSEAEPLYKEALAINKEQLGDNHPSIATNLNNLAGLYESQGRYTEAEPLYKKALAIDKEQLGDNHPHTATSLSNLAGLYRVQGRYAEAEPLYQQALAIDKEQLGENHPLTATSIDNLAALYASQGRYTEAEPLYLEALAIKKEQLGENHPSIANSLNNLAELYESQGQYIEAEPLYQQALAISKKQLGENHPSTATSLDNLAQLYESQGRYTEAEPLYQQALAIKKEQLGENHPSTAISFNNLGLLYKSQGKYTEAEPLYLQALAISKEQLGENHPDIATNLNNLALLFWEQDNIPQTINYLNQGTDIEENLLQQNLIGSDAQKQAYFATFSATTDVTISLHQQAAPNNPQALELALTTIFRRKGRLLDSAAEVISLIRQNLTPEGQTLINELVQTRSQLSSLSAQTTTLSFDSKFRELPQEEYKRRVKELNAKVESLDAQANNLEAQLSRLSAEFRLENQKVTIEGVQAQIPTDSTLIELVLYRPYNPKENTSGEPRYVAYLLNATGKPQWVDLGEAKIIDEKIQQLLKPIQKAETLFKNGDTAEDEEVKTNLQEFKRISRELDTLVMQPIRELLGQQTTHLLIAPDSQLNLIPFEALITENNQYLVEKYAISYLTSGRDLLRFQLKNEPKNNALIVANPDYEASPQEIAQATPNNEVSSQEITQANPNNPTRSVDLLELKEETCCIPLDGTEREAQAIATILNNPTLLTGIEATETAIKEFKRPIILHIATHGFFLEDQPRLEDEEEGISNVNFPLRSGEPISLKTSENPLLRSGLALAGFMPLNNQFEGVLTALEVASLNLSGTKLVVLSACKTGLGDVRNGDGVYGLRRALVLAGSETQLISLWDVSDNVTEQLMSQYYQRLMENKGRHQALRDIQLNFLNSEEYNHPYFWAAFIPSGNWRSMTPSNN